MKPWLKRPGFRGGRGLRLKPGQMNRTEAEHAQELELRLRAGDILAWWFQPFRLRLAEDNAWYTPDFAVMHRDGLLEVQEIKGYWEEAALVRIKVAAALYPFVFAALTKLPKKEGGGWRRREFKGWEDGPPAPAVERPAQTALFAGQEDGP